MDMNTYELFRKDVIFLCSWAWRWTKRLVICILLIAPAVGVWVLGD